MGLSWQQGPLAPERSAGSWCPTRSGAAVVRRTAAPADAGQVRRRLDRRQRGCRAAARARPLPGGLFPGRRHRRRSDEAGGHTTRHRDLGTTSWYTVRAGEHATPRAAWQHTGLPDYAAELKERVAFAWRAMDAFYEEDERIVGHAADTYHRIDIRQTSRHLTVVPATRSIADTSRPLALYESGFAPRWYVPRDDVDQAALTPAQGQTFCPYKGLCQLLRHRRRPPGGLVLRGRLDRGPAHLRPVSFEPDKVEVHLDGARLQLEPGQSVIPHGIDRDLTPDEATRQAAMTGHAVIRDSHGRGQRARAPVLLSVNVGMPRDVPWQGKTVHTGVWKYPVTGPVMVRRLNIDGDGQGDLQGHGGEQRAVMVYQIQSYQHWPQHFGRDDLQLRPVRREPHRRRPARRRGLHRGPVPHRRGRVRGHPAPRHLLPRRPAPGPAPAARAAGLPPPARLLHARASAKGASRPGT